MTAPTRLAGYMDEGSRWSSTFADVLEHVPDLLWPTSVPVYAQMRRDPQLSGVLAGFFLPLRRATWTVDPAGCRDEVVRLVADDLGLPVAGDDKPGAARTRGVSWAEHLRTALLHLVFGHYGFEQLAEIDGQGRARLVGMFERLPQTITQIHTDRQGQLTGISQDVRVKETDAPQINADRLVWYVHDREGSAWQGTSLLRPAYAPWLLKHEMLRVHAISNRRWGMGVPTIEWDSDATPSGAQQTQASAAAQAARAGDTAGLALPPGAHLLLRGLQGNVPDTLAFIRWLDQQMSRMVLAGFMDLGDTPNGSRALGETFVDLFTLNLQAVGDYMADVITRQAAARVVEWNWGDTEPVPRIVVADVGTRHEVTAQALAALLASGAISADPALEAYVRRMSRLPQREAPAPPPAGTGTGQPKPAVAAKRRREPVGQLALPIAAAAEPDQPDQQQQAEQSQAAWVAGVAAVLAAWPDDSTPLVDGLVAAVRAAVESGDVAALADITTPADVVDALAEALVETALPLARDAAEQVAAARTAQVGTATPVPDGHGEDRVRQVAAVTARLIANGYASAATRQALQVAGQSPKQAAEAVRAALVDIGTSQQGLVADQVGALLSAAQNAGRAALFARHPPTQLTALEHNDRNACAPCKDISGSTFNSVAEAVAAYPVAGYVHCEGGHRCRGQLIPRWT